MRQCSIILYVLSLVYISLQLRTSYHCQPPKLENGKLKFRQRNRFVKYSCNVGFMLAGDKYSNCFHGKWDSPPPKCVRQGCRQVNPPNNGLIYPSHLNAVLHFYCKSGYDLHGPNITYCNGTAWSHNMPICLETSTKPPLSCDFEKADICGWTHDLNHDFDWRRMQFNTPSGAIGTGPSFDHTLGEDRGGYYMYIETSSRNENDTARLISPVYEKSDNDTCFQFFYHMYGSTIGSLRVYLKLVNESWNLDPRKAFFEKHGNQGNRWIDYIHLFGPLPADYQIIIEGVRGDGYVSDIAIDDVRIIQDCSPEMLQEYEPSTTTEIEEPSTTDFLPDDVYSCENNCFSTGALIGKHRKCACDENCYERNECCPDFVDFCIIQAGLMTDAESTSSTPMPSRTSTTQKIKTTIEATTQKVTKLATQTSTTQKLTHVPVTYTIHIHPITEILTTDKTTYAYLPDIATTKNDRFIKSTTENNYLDSKTFEMTNKQIIQETTDMANDIPQIPNDMVPIDDAAHFKRKYNERIIILQPKEESNVSFYLALCGVALVLGVVVAIFIRRRNGFRTGGFRSTSHGDSASDVRFLTNDEILDLQLDYE